jgi:hypothetical protein
VGGGVAWLSRQFGSGCGEEEWRNSRDAVERTVNKVRGWCVGKEPNPEE